MNEPGEKISALGIGILNQKPLLIHIIFSTPTPFRFIEALSAALGTTPALVLVTNYWSILSRWKNDLGFKEYLQDFRAHRERYPPHQVVLLANDATELQFLQGYGIDGALFQHNGFIHSYEINTRVTEKEFDAVYIARIERYKRLELAHKLKSVCVVFASADRTYFSEIKPLISHFVFANGDPLTSVSLAEVLGGQRALADSQTPIFSRLEVSDWCARSRTGLCLSAEEGANYASGEYMVWGLPVVSTRSIGGRDDYFDDRFCIMCEDDPDFVATGVEKAISLDIDPRLIRNTFLANMMKNRISLLQLIISRTTEWGGSLERFLEDWLNLSTPFLDRVHSFSVPEILAEIERPAQTWNGR